MPGVFWDFQWMAAGSFQHFYWVDPGLSGKFSFFSSFSYGLAVDDECSCLVDLFCESSSFESESSAFGLDCSLQLCSSSS